MREQRRKKKKDIKFSENHVFIPETATNGIQMFKSGAKKKKKPSYKNPFAEEVSLEISFFEKDNNFKVFTARAVALFFDEMRISQNERKGYFVHLFTRDVFLRQETHVDFFSFASFFPFFFFFLRKRLLFTYARLMEIFFNDKYN